MYTHGISALLITSAAGYWVLTAAGREKSRLKMLGQYLGLLIILISVLGAAGYVARSVRACKMGGYGVCPFSSKGGMMKGVSPAG